jgi:hypothetical protein
MLKFLEKILFPILIINITTSANAWEVFGVGIGQTLYWLIIAIGFTIAYNTPYRVLSIVMLILSFLLRIVEAATSDSVLELVRLATLGLIFVIAGAKIYGNNPGLLNKQFTVFILLSIPIMLLQITGAHYIFMGWNTELAHDTSVLDVSDIGKFKELPVYKTLFVNEDDLTYSIGQGRPVGLLYSNNVLSVFVTIAAALNFIISKDSKIRFSNILIAIIMVLTMSLLGFASSMLLYLFFLFFGVSWRRRKAFNSIVLLISSFALYYFLFPGLFSAFFSESKLYGSLITRFLDIANVLKLDSIAALFDAQREMMGSGFNEENSYSFISILLKSKIAIPAIIGLVILAAFYYYRLNHLKFVAKFPTIIYIVLILVCLMTQFAVPYVGAPSFQLILGLGLFPIFKKLWSIEKYELDEM